MDSALNDNVEGIKVRWHAVTMSPDSIVVERSVVRGVPSKMPRRAKKATRVGDKVTTR